MAVESTPIVWRRASRPYGSASGGRRISPSSTKDMPITSDIDRGVLCLEIQQLGSADRWRRTSLLLPLWRSVAGILGQRGRRPVCGMQRPSQLDIKQWANFITISIAIARGHVRIACLLGEAFLESTPHGQQRWQGGLFKPHPPAGLRQIGQGYPRPGEAVGPSRTFGSALPCG